MNGKLLALIAATGLHAANLEHPRRVEIRLLSHVTSDASPVGTPVRAVVVQPDGSIPVGAIVYGKVSRASRVRLGVFRERALLRLDFHDLELPGGQRRAITANVVSVENAREQVSRDGTIRGVLAASSPGGWVRGLWHRPRPNIVGRAAIGLTGASGTICSRAALGPAGAVGMFAAKTALFRLPDPEIHLTPGVELVLEVHGAGPFTSRAKARPSLARGALAEIPDGVKKPNGRPAGDIINFAFRASREEIVNAFTAAGWYPAEPTTRSSFRRAYHAWVSMRGYPTAPVSPLLYQGRKPDLVFQKSFNTIAKRHHIRIWETVDPDGGTVWVGAATHDTGITFARRRFTLTHRIDPRIDSERRKVIADLDFAGCIRSAVFMDRGNRVPSGEIVTDGSLAVVELAARTGTNSLAIDAPPGKRADKWPVRMARRMSLETRQYLMRDSVYYYAYRSARKLTGALREVRDSRIEGGATAFADNGVRDRRE